MKKPWIALIVLLTISCAEKNEYYTLDDFDKVDKIDTHIHVFADRNSFVNQAKKDNFRLLNIMVDLSKGEELIKEQYDYCLAQKKGHPEDYEFATSFSIEDWDNPDFTKNTIAWLDKSFEEGAIAVKVWKNIGMVFRDKDNELIMVDNPKLDTIFDYLASKKIPLVGHLGEPKNCWLPLDEMTTNNDRKYFSEHPQYHMYQHPELPSYEEQIAARDRMLEKHPDLVFIGAEMQKEMHKMWLTDWRFFVTDELMASDLVNEEFRGLKLPKEAVDKIYFQNAKKWLKMFPSNGI